MSVKQVYKLDLPNFVEPVFEDFFQKRKEYIFSKGIDKNFKNCFISNSGVLLRNCLIPLNSAENLIGNEDQTFYFKHWRKAIEQFFVCKYGKSLKSIRISDSNLYFSIHTPWFGYFSWFTTCIPRLLEVMHKHPNAILLYPQEWDDISYVSESLGLFSNLLIKKIPKDHHVFVSNYILEPCRGWTSHFDKSDLLKVKSFFLSKIPLGSGNSKLRVYISRGKSKRRKIINELELENLLVSLDFKIVYMEDLTFIEQVKLMNETAILLSSHGAGLTNINFLNNNSKVIELTPLIDDMSKFRFPFWRMSNLLNLRYYCLFCTMSQKMSDQYDSDILVDLKKLESLVNQVIQD
jgi:hypothetical protein